MVKYIVFSSALTVTFLGVSPFAFNLLTFSSHYFYLRLIKCFVSCPDLNILRFVLVIWISVAWQWRSL